MSFFDDIKKQSQATRETMFYLSVFITVLVIGMIWFRSFQRNLYVLMNPEENIDQILIVENAPVPSLFSFIWRTADDIKGLAAGLFNGEDEFFVNDLDYGKVKVETGNVYTLPLSEYK